MNILIISDFNIGGQPTMLMRAINKYTPHKARCIIAYDDSFAYDYDILLSKDTLEEAASLAMSWADFYHFGSYIFNFPGVNFNTLVTPKNSCIKYYGSYLRDNGPKCREFHTKSGIAAITGTDWTITGQLDQSFYHLNSYFTKFGNEDDDNIPWCDRYVPEDGPLRICAGSAGHPNKGYNVLVNVINELVREGHSVELDIITGLSNQECLQRKINSHVTFCSLHGGWGISGVESMFLGHVTLTCLDPFVLSLFPDQPSLLVDKDTLKQQILSLIENPQSWERRSMESRKFACQHFKWELIVAKYMYMIDLIMHHAEYAAGGRLPDCIY
jgi:hypothetical protein